MFPCIPCAGSLEWINKLDADLMDLSVLRACLQRRHTDTRTCTLSQSLHDANRSKCPTISIAPGQHLIHYVAWTEGRSFVNGISIEDSVRQTHTVLITKMLTIIKTHEERDTDSMEWTGCDNVPKAKSQGQRNTMLSKSELMPRAQCIFYCIL